MGNKLIFLCALICSAYISYAGHEIYTIYKNKADEQRAINKHVVNTNEAWEALAPVRNRWDKMYTPVTDVVDLFTIMEALRLDYASFSYDMDQIIDGGRENVQYNGVSIGLVRACVKNTVHGMRVTSESIPSLLDDIKRVEKEHNLTFNSISLSDAGDGVTQAVFDALCVYLRGEDKF